MIACSIYAQKRRRGRLDACVRVKFFQASIFKLLVLLDLKPILYILDTYTLKIKFILKKHEICFYNKKAKKKGRV